MHNCLSYDQTECSNTPGSFRCVCVAGYQPSDAGDGNCTNIDECLGITLNTCHTDAACTDTDGSFTCSCNVGYVSLFPHS